MDRGPREYKALFKPLFRGAGGLLIISLIYLTGYTFLEHSHYVHTYQKEQQAELIALQHKIQDQTDKIKQLLKLTGIRIRSAGAKNERIQSILGSTLRFYDPHELPKIQGFSYSKLSSPKMLITRLNISPLKGSPPAFEKTISSELTTFLRKDRLEANLPLLNPEGKIEGILTITVLFSDLKPFLSNFKTLSLQDHNFSRYLTSQDPSFILRPPLGLSEFIHRSLAHYAAFLGYSLFLLLGFLGGAVYLYKIVRSKTKKTVEDLRDALKRGKLELEASYQKALLSQQKDKVQQITSQAHRKLQETLRERWQEQGLQAYNDLTVFKQSLSRTNSPLSSENYFQLVNSSLQLTHLLSQGLIAKTRHEPIRLQSLLEEVSLLFTEKIHRSNITLERTYPEELVFYGDFLFTQLILVNVIGKAIHRVKKRSSLTLKAEIRDTLLYVVVEDQGFASSKELEVHLKRSFDFVVSETILKKMCREAGMSYTYSRSPEGVNKDELLIPLQSEEPKDNNVVPLFS